MNNKLNNMEGQLSIWDALSMEAPDQTVPIHGALNLKKMPIKEHEVSLCYGDLVLIVSMIEDYVRGLDVCMADNLNWQVYYRAKYKKISQKIQEQIEYDYEKKLERCLKNQAKEDTSDIGGEALSLAMKRAMASAKKEQPADQTDQGGQDNQKAAG